MAKKTNGGSGSHNALKNCITRIEKCLDSIEECKSAYMSDCKEIRDEMRQIYADAKELGVDTRAAKTLVRTRILEKQIGKAIDRLDLDQHEAYDQYVSWYETPLAKAAQPAAEQA